MVAHGARSMSFGWLGGSRKASLLVLLLEKGPLGFREAHEALGGSSTTLRADHKLLERYGLVTASKFEAFPFTRPITLTEDGEFAATLLRRVEHRIESIRDDQVEV